MPSLKEFLEALAVAWPVALTALIGCVALLAGNAYGVRYASGIPEWVLTVIFAVAVFAAGICIVFTLQSIGRGFRRLGKWNRTRKYRKAQIVWLHNLNDREHAIMSFLFSSNQQALAYPFGEGRFVGLIAKGLVLSGTGAHTAPAWPHVIPDHIWAEMAKYPDEFGWGTSTRQSARPLVRLCGGSSSRGVMRCGTGKTIILMRGTHAGQGLSIS
ncbi:hypothetical protein [Mesorhizobium neociceri]|uniref:Uncharacterized protein n=1 Tax=Mesorhizobium neociceri TaxID=1307853 RepID=A0A838B373_9HYPH|nr:hypothetical protein [Mesorhizobium neociceri]MBA1140412.1 hypothetical protein [Mesorhizobium neociceri]